MKKKVLKICINEWLNESRDKRELSLCKELGLDVIVQAKALDSTIKCSDDEVDGFKVIRLTAKPLGHSIPTVLNRLASLFTWSNYARKLDADIISGHDLPGLLIGWISNVGKPKNKKAHLVYDSHEFELERNVKRNVIQKKFIKILEGFLIKRCSFIIMVNDSIASEVQQIYGLKEYPVVIRNIPPYWEIDEEECKKKRNEIMKMFRGGGK